MKTKLNSVPEILRQNAELLLKTKKMNLDSKYSEYDSMKLIHELELHQIELEMQNSEIQKNEELKQKELELLHEVLNNQPVGIYQLRVFPIEKWKEKSWTTTDKPPYMLELTNKQFCKILEIDQAELLNKPGKISELIHSDDVEDFVEKNKEANIKEIPFNWEGRLQIGEKIKWIQLESHPNKQVNGDILWTGFMNDITNRKQIEEAKETIEHQFRDIFEKNPAIKLIINPDNGAIINANKAASDYYGYSIESLLKMNIDDINTLSREEILSQMALAKTYYSNYFNFKHKLASGEIRDVEVYSGPIETNGKRILYSIIHDITDRKRVEEDLKNSQEQLKKFASHIQNVREEEKILLATEIHDELSQILMALKIDIGMLKKEVSKGNINAGSESLFAKLDQAYNVVGSSIRTTLKIMSDLRYEVLYLLGFGEAVTLYSEEFEAKYKIKCKFESNVPNLEINQKDSTLLFRILQNAMSNVAEHSKATEVKISLNKTVEKLILEITDNGIGFNQNQQFNSDSYGLIYMKEYASQLNGQLSINCATGSGTVICVEIPLKTAKYVVAN